MAISVWKPSSPHQSQNAAGVAAKGPNKLCPVFPGIIGSSEKLFGPKNGKVYAELLHVYT